MFQFQAHAWQLDIPSVAVIFSVSVHRHVTATVTLAVIGLMIAATI